MMGAGKLTLEADLDEIQSEFRRVQLTFDSGAMPPGFMLDCAVRGRASAGGWFGIVRGNASQLAELEGMAGATVQLFPLNLEDVFVELFSKEEQG
jgi:hypothetical protein